MLVGKQQGMRLLRRYAYALIALMMEAANTSETSVNFYPTTRRNTPEDSLFHTRRRENLKSHYEKKKLNSKS
jgi:hypothetical protein